MVRSTANTFWEWGEYVGLMFYNNLAYVIAANFNLNLITGNVVKVASTGIDVLAVGKRH